MPVYSTFGGVDPTPDKGLAEARVAWQEAILASAIQPLVTTAYNTVEAQEDELAALYAPQMREAGARIAAQDEAIGGVIKDVLAPPRTAISTQAAAIEGIASDGVRDEQGILIGIEPGEAPEEGLPEFPTVEIPSEEIIKGAPGVAPPPGGIVIGGVVITPETHPEYFNLAPGMPFPVPRLVPGDLGGDQAGQLPPVPPIAPAGPVGPGIGIQGPAGGLPGGPMAPIPEAPPEAGPIFIPIPGVPSPINITIPGLPPIIVQPPPPPGQAPPAPTPPPPAEAKPPGQTPVPAPAAPPARPVLAPGMSIPHFPSVCGWDAGERQLCFTIESYLGPFGTIGAAIEELLDKTASTFSVAYTTLYNAVGSIPVAGAAFQAVLELLPADQMLATLKAMRDVPRAGKPVRATLLVGLWGARALLRLAENATLGWELGPQLLLSLHYEMPQLRAIIDYLIDYTCPVRAPSAAEVQHLYLADVIDQVHADCLSRLQGQSPKLLALNTYAARARPTDLTLVADWRRFAGQPAEIHRLLRANGWLNAAEREKLIRSADYLPPPSDLISFAVKDVYSPKKIGRAEMVAEYKEQGDLQDWFASQGIGPVQIARRNGEMISGDVGEAYWLAHYHNVSPTQVFEMLHRLRPDRVGRYKLKGAGGADVIPSPVTIDDVRSLLKEDDYNPAWRDRLAAISYRNLTRVDVRRVYASGGFGVPRGIAGFAPAMGGNLEANGEAEKELVAVNEDAGYVHADAVRLAYFAAKQYTETALAPERKKQARLACATYQAGGIGRDKALAAFRRATDSDERAAAMLDSCDMERHLKELRAGIAAVRKGYLRGEFSDITARDSLGLLGVSQERQAEFFRLWRIEREAQGKQVAASVMCDWHSKGLIGIPEMRQRLLRIGYSTDDAERVIAHCRLGILGREVKEREARIKAEIRDQEKRRKLLEKRQALSEKVEDKRLAQFLAARSEKHLIEWLIAGEITEADVRRTLLLKGWVAGDIDRWFKVTLGAARKKAQGGGKEQGGE